MMQKYICILALLILNLIIGTSCSEKEKELELSPNMLLAIRMSVPIIEMDLQNEVLKKEITEAISQKLMDDSVRFTRGYVYEMLLDKNNTIDTYKSLEDFKKGSKFRSGKYIFSDNEMKVSYIMNDEERSFGIDGYASSLFYNHFTHNKGSGEYHVVEDSKVFCLHDDYTAHFREVYPNAQIRKVIIKTDVITIRALETFK